jgi:hypothetical protein
MVDSEIQRLAATDNAALCAAMWRAHGLAVERGAGCVACAGTPPRFYPNVVTVDPTTDPRDQLEWIAARSERDVGAFFVKDSYRLLALDELGFEPLIEAQWIHRPVGTAADTTRLDWRTVTDAGALAAWEVAWSNGAAEPPLFLPQFLADPSVTMLAGWTNRAIAAGCIVTVTGAVAGVSNVFGDAREAIGAAAAASAGGDLVGYENGDALAAALDAGFRTVGGLVVWKRPSIISDNLP